MDYKKRVEYYYKEFEKVGLFNRRKFNKNSFVENLYHHYENLVDDCAGLMKDENLMCCHCRSWYNFTIKQISEDEYDVFDGLEKKHLDYLIELVKAKGE